MLQFWAGMTRNAVHSTELGRVIDTTLLYNIAAMLRVCRFGQNASGKAL